MHARILAAAALVLMAVVTPAMAVEPVKRITIEVTPYYSAAPTPDGQPQVAVGATYDALLASNKREDIVKARDMIQADPSRVTPMTLMVLAIRMYDVGLRDDSVFWFYVAKYRYMTLRDVIDVPALNGDFEATMGAFVATAGPFINSYAFCDVAKQQQAETKSIAWVEQHPYAVLFMAQMPARPGDRNANLKQSLAGIHTAIDKERAMLNDPAQLAQLKAARQQNNVDAQFCWRE